MSIYIIMTPLMRSCL